MVQQEVLLAELVAVVQVTVEVPLLQVLLILVGVAVHLIVQLLVMAVQV